MRTALCSIARKNGKTSLASGIVLAHLFIPQLQKKNAQLVSLACDRDQAGLVFEKLHQILLQCPQLLTTVNIQTFTKRIRHKETGMTYRALASDGSRNQGLSPYLAIIDEAGEYKKSDAYFAIKTAGGAHDEALCLIVSTSAGTPENCFAQEVVRAKKIIAGEIQDDSFYSKIYEASPSDDFADPATWAKANPSLGTVRNAKELKQFYAQCKHLPSQFAAFKRYYMNVPYTKVGADVEWIARQTWMDCGVERFGLDVFKGKECVLGLDMSSTLDLTALTLLSEDFHIWTWVWCARKALENLATLDLYGAWIDMGLMQVSQGEGIEFDIDVLPRLTQIIKDYDCRAMGYDRWRLETIKSIFAKEEIELDLVPVGQGFGTQTQLVELCEKLVLNKQLKHNANPLLTFAVTNAVVVRDAAGSKKLTKAVSKDKIDPLMSLLNSLHVSKKITETITANPFLFSL